MLERQLLSAGEVVVQVSQKLMGSVRRSGRELGKSDPIDALAVARAAMREPHLPVAGLEGKSREVKLLVDHREDLVGERTRIQNRLLWHLHELEPGYQVVASGLLRTVVLAEVSSRLQSHSGVVAEIARELVARLAELTQSVKRLQRRIDGLMRELAPSFLNLPGCAELSAAKLWVEESALCHFPVRADVAPT